jgi:hypothetical protein
MLLTYHGVLGPAAGMRDRVVRCRRCLPMTTPPTMAATTMANVNASGLRLRPALPTRCRMSQSSTTRCAAAESRPFPTLRPRTAGLANATPGAELLRPVHLIEVLTCPNCHGRRTLVAAIHDPDSMRRILQHFCLHADPPALDRRKPLWDEGPMSPAPCPMLSRPRAADPASSQRDWGA